MGNLNSPIESLEKVNPNVLTELHKLGLYSAKDLLFDFPSRHEDFSNVVKIADMQPEQAVSIHTTIKDIKAIHGFGKMRNRAEALVSDHTGSLKVVWFNQYYLANTLHKDDEIFLAGKVALYKNTLQLQNPVYEKFNDGGDQIHTGRILPIYKLSGYLSLRALRTLIFHAQKYANQVEETLPQEIIKSLAFPSIVETIRSLHFPESAGQLEKAKRRMAFEEIFTVQLAVQKHKLQMQTKKAYPIIFKKTLIQKFLGELPFELTLGQKKATWDILQDMQKQTPMNRLLEGDVGSGKTLVAFAAALEALNQNLQVALLCPTEILAEQHYQTALKYFESFSNISLIFLTSKQAKLNGNTTPKKILLEEIKHGGPQLIISTHAVLEKSVQFKKLALVIIDEQHRFGVRQRAALKQKSAKVMPHLLSMTATPIPRSLKLTLFGDLQISQIKTLPKGRKGIITKYAPESARDKCYQFIDQQIKAGHQVFVVTPLIEESDVLGVKSAIAEKENLQKVFPKIALGLLHGKMKTLEKEQIMSDFLQNKLKILVSTSIIEVGVDVPNTSVMVIEGADRFGLAQLHQFRGRVGRAEHQSYCFLFTKNTSEKAIERLKKMETISSGFELAELDLKNRGFGNIFGEEQSGFYFFKYFSFSDQDLALAAKQWANKILGEDLELTEYPALQKKIENKIIHLE